MVPNNTKLGFSEKIKMEFESNNRFPTILEVASSFVK